MSTAVHAEAIIAKIKEHRDRFRDAAAFGTADDPPRASQAQVCWEIADEYDSLLAEIESAEK